MNILFLSQRIPEPPNKGDKIRSHHLLKRIASRHSVHVACLLDEAGERPHVERAREWAASVTWRVRRPVESAWRGATAPLAGRPITVGYFRSGGLAQDVRGLLARESIDVVVVYCSSMAGYVGSWDGPKVLDFVDVDSEKWGQYARESGIPRRAIYALEQRLLRSYEKRLVKEFDRSILISEAERSVFATFADAERVEVVTNGVDVQSFARRGPRATEPRLVFVGALDYFANEDGVIRFAREAMPAVRERVPGARLRVVGRKPGPAVRALAELPGVDVVGEVDDVREELWGAALAVVPLRIAQGLQNKVLEAMAAGIPVVSSPAAVRGIEGESGGEFLRADGPDEWAGAVERVLSNPGEAEEMVARALRMVRERYSWDRKAEEYERIVEAVVARRGVPAGGAV